MFELFTPPVPTSAAADGRGNRGVGAGVDESMVLPVNDTMTSGPMSASDVSFPPTTSGSGLGRSRSRI
eukprot:15442903-Alexandrium_andersonii.AAC.1